MTAIYVLCGKRKKSLIRDAVSVLPITRWYWMGKRQWQNVAREGHYLRKSETSEKGDEERMRQREKNDRRWQNGRAGNDVTAVYVNDNVELRKTFCWRAAPAQPEKRNRSPNLTMIKFILFLELANLFATDRINGREVTTLLFSLLYFLIISTENSHSITEFVFNNSRKINFPTGCSHRCFKIVTLLPR